MSDPANWRSTTSSSLDSHLIRLTRRAQDNRKVVMTPETLGDVVFAALLAAQATGPGV